MGYSTGFEPLVHPYILGVKTTGFECVRATRIEPVRATRIEPVRVTGVESLKNLLGSNC